MRAVDRAKERSLVFRGGDPAAGEIEMAGPQDGEQDPYQRGQTKDALLEPEDFDPEGFLGRVDVPNGEDGRSRRLEPSSRCRAGNAEPSGDPGVSRLPDEVAQPMVVSSLWAAHPGVYPAQGASSVLVRLGFAGCSKRLLDQFRAHIETGLAHRDQDRRHAIEHSASLRERQDSRSSDPRETELLGGAPSPTVIENDPAGASSSARAIAADSPAPS
jgi:hypothetical protein